MMDSPVSLREFVERIFDEREKQVDERFKAIEERLKRQLTVVSIFTGFLGGLIGALVVAMSK